MSKGNITLALIVACARNGTIGKDNQIPWHLPDDLKHFKALTLGKPVIMGRRTWDSLRNPRPLPGRANIVVSRQAGFQAEGATAVKDLHAAVAKAREIAKRDGVNEVFVMGGDQIYQGTLPYIQRAYITKIDEDIEGDAFFPALNPHEWKEVARENFSPCERNAYPYSFVKMERATGGKYCDHDGTSTD